MRCSLVIPVYRNEASLPALLSALQGLAPSLPGPLELVFVVDGSPDRSFELLRSQLGSMPFSSQLLSHSRNFGAFAAIRTGLAAAKGELFAVMAADLQEPISLVERFFAALAAGEADVVVGQRTGRADPGASKAAASLFWSLYRKLVNPEIPPGGVDVFGCNRAALSALLKLDESNSSLVAQLFWIGFRRQAIPYARLEREQGTSSWTLRKKLRYLSDSVYAFTDLPIRLVTWAGALTMSTAAALGLVVFGSWLAGRITVLGYTPVILAIAFFGGLNAMALGIVGAYVWRAFENTKARPASLVLHQLEFIGDHALPQSGPARVEGAAEAAGALPRR